MARVYLFVRRQNINELLLQQGYAERTEEDYMSKVCDFHLYCNNISLFKILSMTFVLFQSDHANRRQRQTTADLDLLDQDEMGMMVFDDDEEDPKPPNRGLCVEEVRLSGPFSPLETNIYSTTLSGGAKCISVDPQSVNSILLDNNPQV